MKEYIENIIPRLKEFSQSLDRKEVFVDVPWVLVDADGGFQKYIFKRNGELVMSRNGTVTIGKWEYLAAAKSLLVDRVTDKILLNQNFIDQAVMVLNQDGILGSYFILANEILIPNLDFETYFKRVYLSGKTLKLNDNIIKRQTRSGIILDFHGKSVELGVNVTINEEAAKDGVYVGEERIYVINDSKLSQIICIDRVTTVKGLLEIHYQCGMNSAAKGNLVFLNGLTAPNGKYHLLFLSNIFVENGVIVKTSMF